MLQAYNCLFPYEFQTLQDDEYVKAMVARIESHRLIIEANATSSKTGALISPCVIHDVDDNTFEFRDGLGRSIDTHITMVNSGDGWINVDFTGPISKNNDLYKKKGKVVFVKFEIKPILFNKTLTGSIETDGKMFSLLYYDRLEFLYNSRIGATYIQKDSKISSFDKTTGKMVTDSGTYMLTYPDAVKFKEGDTVPANTFVDKVVNLSIEPPYVKISIKKEYSYLKKIFTFDSNKIIDLVD